MVEREAAEVRGVSIPKVGLGTWRLTGETCRRTVETALELGYRHVDTAQTYGNERAVGRALADADVDPEAVFLTTKVAPHRSRYDDLLASAEESASRLGVDAVDLLLLHWPNPFVPLEETMAALDAAREAGLCRHVGVSNFGVDRLRRARRLAESPLLADQVQFHVYRPRRELLRYCQQNDLLLTAYSPLGHGGVLDDEALRAVGRRYGKSPAQVAIRWATQHRNVVAIPKATSRAHLAENLAVFDVTLSREEIDRLTRPSLVKAGLALVRGHL
jgi:diketogulonate reductase-like aldo/keto reductase